MKYGNFFLIATIILSSIVTVSHAACSNPTGTESNIVYNTDSNVHQFCNGSDWIAMGPINPAASGPGCASPTGAESDIVYNDTSNTMQFCNSASWISMGPVPGTGGSGCTNPTNTEGALIYNDDHNVMQYCDGTNWRQIGRLDTGGDTGGDGWHSSITYTPTPTTNLLCGTPSEAPLNNESIARSTGRYGSDGFQPEALTADLGSAKTVNTVRYGGLTCSAYQDEYDGCEEEWNGNPVSLEYSNDNSSWTIITADMPDYSLSELRNYTFPAITARYIKLGFSTAPCTGQFRLGNF